jgi:hypothetical protein
MIKILTKKRDETHYIKEHMYQGRLVRLPDLEKFLSDNKDKLHDEITLGYYAHLIEDRIWFDAYIGSFAKCIDKENILYTSDNTIHNTEEFRKDIYSDYINVDSYIIEKNNIDIDKIRLELKKELIEYKIDKVIDENLVTPVKFVELKNNFISSSCLNRYIDESVEKVKKEMIRILGE